MWSDDSDIDLMECSTCDKAFFGSTNYCDDCYEEREQFELEFDSANIIIDCYRKHLRIKTNAAKIIQAYYKECYYNPKYHLCITRLKNEFTSMCEHLKKE